MFFGSNHIEKEVNFILSKLNRFLEINMLELLYRRLFEITGCTIDNFDTILLPYIQNLSGTALFDNNTLRIGINILNNNQPITEEIKSKVRRLIIDKSDMLIIKK